VVGIIVAMVLYIVRVLFLNDSFAGHVAALVLGLVLITVICALTSGRLPLWAALAGVALVTGAYETAFIDASQNVTTELFQYTTQALVPAAFGFLATIFVSERLVPAAPAETAADTAGPPPESPSMAPATTAPAASAPPPSSPPPPPGTNRQV
jgi:hypothetical protein